MLRAVILDAYGTILNTGDGSVRATESILRKHGVPLNSAEMYAKWKRYHREHIASLQAFVTEETIFRKDLERIYREYGLSGDAASDVAIMLSTLGTRVAFAEAVRAIAEMRQHWRVYIGSNSDTVPLLADIERNGIEVDGVFSSETLRAYKPGREFFLQLLQRIVCSPEEVAYVGDSLADDIAGAGSAGIKAVWVDRKNQGLRANVPAPVVAVRDLSTLTRDLLRAFGTETVAQPSAHEDGLPVFGTSREGCIERPGAYAIIHDAEGRLALDRVGSDYFLPGGGIEEGEEPSLALERELREELGIRPTGFRALGEAIEYWRSPVSGRSLRTHAYFFFVTQYEPVSFQVDKNSSPAWVSPQEAVRRLLRPAQQWYAHQHGAHAEASR
jgi:2-haloalkanoic acid dehalogenase type II